MFIALMLSCLLSCFYYSKNRKLLQASREIVPDKSKRAEATEQAETEIAEETTAPEETEDPIPDITQEEATMVIFRGTCGIDLTWEMNDECVLTISGTDKIGRVFADICRGFGMKVLACDKFSNPDAGHDHVEQDELCEKSNVISLRCPLTVWLLSIPPGVAL